MLFRKKGYLNEYGATFLFLYRDKIIMCGNEAIAKYVIINLAG